MDDQPMAPDPANDDDWSQWKSAWQLDPVVTFLNHGSFGPAPTSVLAAQRAWQEQLQRDPMHFFVAKLEPALAAARRRLADFVDADEGDLIFVENATMAMNIVANSYPLQPGDEVVLSDHVYGAVRRIWTRACERFADNVPRIAELPEPIVAADQVVDAIMDVVTPATKLLVISHITSATAVTLPVEAICVAAHAAGIDVCIDGPHAVAQLPLSMRTLDCDFYAASNHKWLSAPFGSGFLYVHPRHQAKIQPNNLSWGRLKPNPIETWADEFTWSGTRDPSAYLATTAAIEFLERVGLAEFRARTHHLAQYARKQLTELLQTEPLVPDDARWYGSMAQVEIPNVTKEAMHEFARSEKFELLFEQRQDRVLMRVSCHLYNSHADIDRLVDALGRYLRRDP